MSGIRFVALVLCVSSISIVLGSSGVGARGREVPFPAEKTAILREEKVVYTVEGRRTIPEGVEVTCLRDVHVIGKGEDAVIEVQGSLKVHGVEDREVIFENVTIELAPKFRDVQMDQTFFRKGAKLRTPPEKSVSGKLFLELLDFKDDADMDVTFHDGTIDFRTVCSDRPVRLRAVTPPDKEENRIKLFMLGCSEWPFNANHPGLVGGLIVEGFYDATVRICRLGGPLSSFKNCRTLLFDGCKVNSKRLEFHQDEAGGFKRTTILKCDIYSEQVSVFSGKIDEKTVDKVRVARCWFRGMQDPKVVHASVIEDSADDVKGQNAAQVILSKLGKRPLELAGKWDR